jgi:site-specific DNA-methyltransferase (adenine-specific)/modification methylase
MAEPRKEVLADGVEIWLGDCREVLPLLGNVDAVVTDPPYGINREGIANDNPEGLRALFDGCLAVMPVTDAVMIVFQSPRLEWVWLDAARAVGWKPERLLWLYRTGQNAYPWRGWYMRSDAVRVCSFGRPLWPDFPEASTDCYTVNINDTESVKASAVGAVSLHSTVKPVDVIANLIDHTTGVVYEPFSGSGTTIIACENLRRRCRAVEISPGYVAVTLQRWADHTGKTPVRID